MIAVEQVGVLETHAQPQQAGVGGAGVVQRRHQPPRPVIGDAHIDVHQILRGPRAQQHGGLLHRMFGADLQIARDLVGIRRRALFHRGQRTAHVLRAEMLIALDNHLADLRLGDIEAHHAAGDILLRQQHLDHAVAAFTIGALQRLQRALDIREILLLAGKRRHNSLRGGGAEHGVADHLKALDIEFWRGDHRILGEAGADDEAQAQRQTRHSNQSLLQSHIVTLCF